MVQSPRGHLKRFRVYKSNWHLVDRMHLRRVAGSDSDFPGRKLPGSNSTSHQRFGNTELWRHLLHHEQTSFRIPKVSAEKIKTELPNFVSFRQSFRTWRFIENADIQSKQAILRWRVPKSSLLWWFLNQTYTTVKRKMLLQIHSTGQLITLNQLKFFWKIL